VIQWLRCLRNLSNIFILVTEENEKLATFMANNENQVAGAEPMFVGDHPALDLLNSVARPEGKLVDSFERESDVLEWLARAGWPVESAPEDLRPQSLVQTARTLRETIRTLVEGRKAGKRVDPDALNSFLAEARSSMKLAQKKDGNLQLKRKWKQRTAGEILAPLAESAAELLANGDFDRVRRCQNDECVLWFYDRTKSHHRRWCSMATCGNRHKVMAFRQRRQQA
jgi:predicted RNA-binding Zn ribbon-like protein